MVSRVWLQVKRESVSCSVVSDSMHPHGLHPPGSSIYGILQARILEWLATRKAPWLQGVCVICLVGFQPHSRCARKCAKLHQSCLTLCDPMDCGHQAPLSMEIIQARTLVWVSMPSSRGSSQPRDWTPVPWVSGIAGSFFTPEPPGKPHRAGKGPWTQLYHLLAAGPALTVSASRRNLFLVQKELYSYLYYSPEFVHFTFPNYWTIHSSSLRFQQPFGIKYGNSGVKSRIHFCIVICIHVNINF